MSMGLYQLIALIAQEPHVWFDVRKGEQQQLKSEYHICQGAILEATQKVSWKCHCHPCWSLNWNLTPGIWNTTKNLPNIKTVLEKHLSINIFFWGGGNELCPFEPCLMLSLQDSFYHWFTLFLETLLLSVLLHSSLQSFLSEINTTKLATQGSAFDKGEEQRQ